MDRFEELKKFGKESIVIRDARLPDYDQVSVLEEPEYRLHREARVFLIFAKAAVLRNPCKFLKIIMGVCVCVYVMCMCVCHVYM